MGILAASSEELRLRVIGVSHTTTPTHIHVFTTVTIACGNYKRNLRFLFLVSSRGTMLATHTLLAQRLKVIGVVFYSLCMPSLHRLGVTLP